MGWLAEVGGDVGLPRCFRGASRGGTAHGMIRPPTERRDLLAMEEDRRRTHRRRRSSRSRRAAEPSSRTAATGRARRRTRERRLESRTITTWIQADQGARPRNADSRINGPRSTGRGSADSTDLFHGTRTSGGSNGSFYGTRISRITDLSRDADRADRGPSTGTRITRIADLHGTRIDADHRNYWIREQPRPVRIP